VIKLILPLLFLSLNSFGQTPCANKIDNNKVMLFVDANMGDMEIETARSAACKRGERFEVVPKNYKEMTKYNNAVQAASLKFDQCVSRTNDFRKCPAEEKASGEAYDKLREYNKSQPQIKDQVASTLEELNKQKVKLTNLTISGHDGGGSFGGAKGSFSRYDFSEMIKNYPEMNEVESVLLLGCYTGVREELNSWRKIFPKLKLMGGYDGSAPNSTRPQGHKYITDILVKEKSLTSLKKSSTVDHDVKAMLGGLEQLNAAVYLNTACQDNEDGFYYASKIGDHKFNKFVLNDCEKKVDELTALSVEFQKYESGELEPPTDTGPNGALRKLYDKVRTYEHCLQDGQYSMNANTTFFLLFWNGLKKNFANLYGEDMSEAEKILSELNPDDVVADLKKMNQKLEAEKEKFLKDIEEFQRDPEGMTKKFNDEVAAIQAKIQEKVAKKEYHDLINRPMGRDYTPEEMKILNEVNQLFNEQNEKMWTDPRNLKMQAENKDYEIARNNNTINKVQSTDFIKNVWVPTKANLEKKSRKEILDNMHAISELAELQALTPKQKAAVSFVSNTTNSHLRYMNNPFSWHEFTGETERPEFRSSLAEYIKSYEVPSGGSVSGSGYGGDWGGNPYGAGGGGMYGGGYIGGGMGGGGIGGYNQQQQIQQPQPQQVPVEQPHD
jgi:hypothetical protein